MIPENKLIELCRTGKPEALSELYKCYSARMFGVCLRYAGNRSDAQDLLHDGFIKVFTGLNEYKGNGSFEGWIRRIMVNTAINYYKRKAGKFYEPGENFEAPSAFPEPDIIEILSAGELLEIINKMPDGYRLIFNMHVIEGYKHTEISEILGISEGTSKTQFMKARKYLMKKVKNELYEKV